MFFCYFRESIYRLLPQTTPENIAKNFDQYTIDPSTRYPNLNSSCIRPLQVSLFSTTSILQTSRVDTFLFEVSFFFRCVTCTSLESLTPPLWSALLPYVGLSISTDEARSQQTGTSFFCLLCSYSNS